MEILVKVKRKCSQVAIHGLGVEEEEPKLIRKMCKIKEKSFGKCDFYCINPCDCV